MNLASTKSINSRVYLTSARRDYVVVFKDNSGTVVIWKMPVPTYGIGCAIVRAIREYAHTRDGRFF